MKRAKVVAKSHIRFPNFAAEPEWLSSAEPRFRATKNCHNHKRLRAQKGDRLRYKVLE